MITRLFRPFTVVKPIRPNDDRAGWLAYSTTAWSEFADDRHRYGWRVALHNLWVLIR